MMAHPGPLCHCEVSRWRLAWACARGQQCTRDLDLRHLPMTRAEQSRAEQSSAEQSKVQCTASTTGGCCEPRSKRALAERVRLPAWYREAVDRPW